LDTYDKVLISRVFTDTEIPEGIVDKVNVTIGGTGFFYDKYSEANFLPHEIEHIKPDYTFYEDWVRDALTQKGVTDTDLKYYTNASVGFLTRGCFRKCSFCVNRNSKGSAFWSSLDEFVDVSRRVVCLLDDNFLSCPSWRELLTDLTSFVKKNKLKYEFKQGMDVRLLTDSKAKALAESQRFYNGEYIFAFDLIEQEVAVTHGLSILRKHLPKKSAKAYILCGFDSVGVSDIISIYYRLMVLWQYKCLGYLMQYNRGAHIKDPYQKIYTNLARWLNQPGLQRGMPFRVLCNKSGAGAAKSLRIVEDLHPELSDLFDLVYPYSSGEYIDANYTDAWNVRDFKEDHPDVVAYREDVKRKSRESRERKKRLKGNK